MKELSTKTGSLLTQEECDHGLAGKTTHQCPECGGFMRRCCNSTLGTAHRAPCAFTTRKVEVATDEYTNIPDEILYGADEDEDS